MPKVPTCEAIVFCQQVKMHNETLFDLLRVVNGPIGAPFGKRLPPMYLYLALNDVVLDGAFKIHVDMVNLDLEVEGVEDCSAFHIETDVKGSGQRTPQGARSAMLIPVTPTFTKEGVHALRVWWGNNLLANMCVTVKAVR